MKNNNAMHYKMYKAKKNIVYAGLVTTAMLAGLTLTNVNNNANADTVDAQTTAAAAAQTPATDSQIQSAQAQVSAASANVTSAQNAVSSAQASVASAQNLNSDVAAVSKAEIAYQDAIDQQNQAGKASAQAQSNYVAASEAAADAIHVAATNKGFGETDTLTNNAAQQAVAYWDAISAQANDNLASVATARPAYDTKLAQAKEDYAVQSNYVADLAKKQKALLSEASSAQAASDTALYNVKSAAAADMFNKYNSAAYQLNTTYTNNMNSAQHDVDYFNNLEALYNKNMSQAKDALAKLSAYLTAKSANETAYQAAIAAVVATGKAEKAYVDAMEAHNLPNAQELKKLSDNAAVNNNWSKYYQNQLDNYAPYKDAQSAVNKANSAQTAAQTSVDNYSDAVASDQTALNSANDALSAAIAQIAVANTESEKNAAYAAKAAAEDAVSRAQAQLDADKASLATANKTLRNAKKLVSAANKNMDNVLKSTITVDEGTEQVPMKVSDLISVVSDWNAKAKTATDKYNSALKNLASVKDVQAALEAAQAELATAKANLATAQGAYQDALDALNALKPGENPSKPDDGNQPSKPDDGNQGGNTGDNNQGGNNQGGNTNNGNANNGNNNQGGSSVNGGANAGSANGSVVAGEGSSAVTGNAASTSSNQATNNGNGEALPQTGNENSAAIVALGAVSAMFGLGLAAKKREF